MSKLNSLHRGTPAIVGADVPAGDIAGQGHGKVIKDR